MMQNCQSEYDVETLVGKFQIMGVHYSEIAREVVPSGGSASSLELHFGDIDAGDLRRPVAVSAQARLPFLGTDLEHALARRVQHRRANHLAATLAADAFIQIGQHRIEFAARVLATVVKFSFPPYPSLQIRRHPFLAMYLYRRGATS